MLVCSRHLPCALLSLLLFLTVPAISGPADAVHLGHGLPVFQPQHRLCLLQALPALPTRCGPSFGLCHTAECPRCDAWLSSRLDPRQLLGPGHVLSLLHQSPHRVGP